MAEAPESELKKTKLDDYHIQVIDQSQQPREKASANVSVVESELQKLSLKDDTILNASSIEVERGIVLVRGQWGVLVYRARKKSGNTRDNDRTVAVKQSTNRDDMNQQGLLINEIKMRCYLASHPNIVAFIGVFTDEMGLSIVMENVSQTLSAFLVANKPTFDEKLRSVRSLEALLAAERGGRKSPPRSILNPFRLSKSASSNGDEVGMKMLYGFALQVATAMEYLSSMNVVLGELAARNVLITELPVVKIGDFGMSRRLTADQYYFADPNTQEPKVSTPQSIGLSLATDIWSFGLLLWEICSLGEQCYMTLLQLSHTESMLPRLSSSSGTSRFVADAPGRVAQSLEYFSAEKSEMLLQKPTFASAKMHSLINDCCRANESARPNFNVCKQRIQAEIAESLG